MAYNQNTGFQQPQQQFQQPSQQPMQTQPMQGHIAPSQPANNDPWSPSAGGGGLAEFVGTVVNCKPDSNKQDPTKQNLTWEMQTHEGKPQNKSWGIGKDWQFNWAGQPPAYVDPKNPSRTVNENATLGVLLRCVRDGAPFDLRSAGPALRSRPGGPLSPVAWVGTRWHFCKVVLDFGQGPREVLFPIAFLGTTQEPMPQFAWKTQDHSSQQMGGQVAGMQQPMGQQQFQNQQQLAQNFQAQAPQQQFQQPNQQPQQPQNYQAQQPMQGQPPMQGQYPQGQGQPNGYQQPNQQQYQQPNQQPNQQQGYGGGPAAGQQFHG